MKKTFCDKCEQELTDKNNTGVDDNNFELQVDGGKVNIIISQPLEGVKYRFSDLCIECFFDIIDKYDTRPRQAAE